MLVRAYRLTDKVGILALKSAAALADWLVSGLTVVTTAVRRGGGAVMRVVFAVLLAVAGLLYAVLKRLAQIILLILRLLVTLVTRIARLVGQGANRAAGGAGLIGQRSSRTGADSAGGFMARRAARAALDVQIAEDPLRVQNRLLSRLAVVLLVVLVGVVLWATNPARTTPTGLVPVNGQNISFLPATPLPNVENPAATIPVLLSTPVPTATALPSILEVRGALAYTVRERGQSDIWAVNIGSRSAIRLTNDPADDRDPAWSPDGLRLAYASRQDGNWEIYIYDLPTNTTTRMTFDLSFQGGPQWSPDGRWLVYESYQGSNLDIYVMPVDGSRPPQRVTEHPAPDFSPAWSPDGRRIAFVSWRTGSQDIFIFSLDNPSDAASVNITNTPDRQEDNPAWDPTGELLAYSALDQGVEKVFVRSSTDVTATAQVLERGRAPSWAPNGASLVFAVDSLESSQMVVSPFTETGVATLIIPAPLGATDPTWSSAPLPTALINAGGLPPAVTQSLFIEQENNPDAAGLYKLGQLVGVRAPSPYLSERVNDSYNALRERTLDTSGWDFLGELEDAFWQIDRPPQPGEERRNWYMTGRQFGINRNLIVGFPARLEVVREDIGVQTYWRVFVRAADDAQSGELGEPLRRMPWDVLSRESGDVAAYDQGGRLRVEVPSGYYVDFTQVAADYGWVRVPAGSDWRANFNSMNYWLFRKSDGLDWYLAMRELYTDGQLGGFAPTAPAAPTAVPVQQP